ncbi:glycosyltransferase family 2 protein [Alteromonas stellipolaris]|uniref:glycosyltransferase family 2 protein n=1 Tax=Alteromonas stellipolaris TaxID=233316 RepID=UPI0021184CAE|nr:glycosyltransferase family 2 protein [Alteromonas stellipolaris]MCQ8847214.1 glycosyltransferase family 2 protein [Alteromonas stellipolaris]MDO6539759.1 glycosyltransferase family 2 protein [Alteromonas stellipolaris]
MQKTVSVIITTHNRPDYLKESLAAVLKQTVLPSEIFVIDDGSSVSYEEVINLFPREKFEYIKVPVASGANAARNLGISKSQSDIIAFLDDDDIWDEDYLEQHINAHDNADAVTCGYRFLETPEKIHINTTEVITTDVIKKGNKFCGMSGVTCKTSLAKKLMFDEELKNSQDWDFFVRITLENAKFHNIAKDIYFYRRGHNSISTEVANMPLEKVFPRLKAFKKHKELLGKQAYNDRVANQILSQIGKKKSKLRWIALSVKEAGLTATTKVILGKDRIRKKLGK